MMRRVVILALFIVGALLWWIYDTNKLPPGVQSKGPEDWMPWLSLLGSVVAIVSGVVTTILEILRHKKS
jgi:purine-cytosine permease-like protein